MYHKILIIQTAFIGDVVLATGLIEKLHKGFPSSQIDFLVRKGNEGLLTNHPFLHKVVVWNKKENKLLNLWKLILQVRRAKYDLVINIQRFASTGLITAFSGARERIGFDKNPFSIFFSRRIKHAISDGSSSKHEIERNNDLVREITDPTLIKPKLYPTDADYREISDYVRTPLITISPASVWFTKQYPVDKWISFIRQLPGQYTVYLLGSPADSPLAEEIIKQVNKASVMNLCGKLSFLQSAALMKQATMNFVNDSAPLHFASAMNAPVTAVYCSTIPAFGYGPLSDRSFIVESKELLACRPCGLHGRKACPLGHFNCAYQIQDQQLLNSLG